MSTLASIVDGPVFVLAGWTLIVILIETFVLASLLAIWRLLRPRATAQCQYAASVAAFVAMVLVAAMTPLALRAIPPSIASVRPSVSRDLVDSARSADVPSGRLTIVASGSSQRMAIAPNTIVSGLGLVWIVGVAILGSRLLGGIVLAAWIRRRATPVSDDSLLGAATKLREELGVVGSVELFQSPHVESPVVIGWWRAALILPSGVVASLQRETFVPLLAHEFAHVHRRDYLANLLQSIAELPLFFSPAVVWVSRRVRESREYCCDDAAARRCGNARSYIEALMTLASLTTLNPPRPAMGVSGPRLLLRVRRLLEGESRPKLVLFRIVGLAATVMVLLISGWWVAVSAADASRVKPAVGAVRTPFRQTPVPYGYGTPDGAGVEFERLTHTAEQAIAAVTLRNVTIEPVTAVRFVAVVERFPRSGPVQIVVSDLVAVPIPPRQSAAVSNVKFPSELSEAFASADRLQVFMSVQAVRYANGAVWQMTPNPAALDSRDALGFARPELPREFLVNQSARAPSTALCRDQNDRTYSLGAVVAVRHEPGRSARCVAGRWEDYAR